MLGQDQHPHLTPRERPDRPLGGRHQGQDLPSQQDGGPQQGPGPRHLRLPVAGSPGPLGPHTPQRHPRGCTRSTYGATHHAL